LWATITEEMQSVDDDYVLERVLACAYGTHLRGDDGPALAALAKIVAPMLTNDVRANALIRDHARCICDLALRRGLDVNFTSEQLQPPFGSEWPLRIPTEEDLSLFKTSEARREHPNLYESTIDDFRGDFAIYTVPHVIRPYKDSVDGAAASRWIFQQVLDFGYTPERFRGYDAYMIGKFGGGRGRPKWAERIGKKYQWIALARLLGRLADHVRPNEEDWEDSIPKTLTAQSLRDLDVSADGLPAADEIEYKKDDSDLTTNKPSLDEQWVVDAGEVSTIEDSLWDYRKGDGEIWFPLEAHVSYVDGHVRPGDLGFRRQIWLQCRSYLVPKNDFQRLWNWMRSKNFMGRWMPEGQTIYNNVFVGEYPRGLSLGNDGMPDRRAEPLDGIRCSVIPTTHDVTPEFTEDSSGVPRLRLTVPVPQLLEGRRWNGRGGYLDGAGQLVFVDPSAEHDGINGCFVRQQELQTYLNKHDLSVVWTVLAEKLPGNYETVRRLEYSHIRGLHEGTVRSARDPVITRR
jgi:hypothetical protein